MRRIAIRSRRWVSRRRRRLIGAAFILLAVVVATGLNVLSWPFSRPTVMGHSGQAAAMTEPQATAAYMRGQQTYDARAVWEAYSERVLQDLERRGASLEDEQRRLDRARELGVRIGEVEYVGGYGLPNGSIHFYVATRTSRTRDEVVYVPYIFTLDPSGKIEDVDSSSSWLGPPRSTPTMS
jgi:hypothetical protein